MHEVFGDMHVLGMLGNFDLFRFVLLDLHHLVSGMRLGEHRLSGIDRRFHDGNLDDLRRGRPTCRFGMLTPDNIREQLSCQLRGIALHCRPAVGNTSFKHEGTKKFTKITK